MTLDICNYTNVKLCDEYGINKRFEFLFYNVCNLLLNGANSNYILPIASDDTLGGIKVGDGLIITSDGVLSVIPNYLSIPKFGIEDNLGIQDREVDMETFSFEMFSIDPDFNSYSAFLLDGSSSSFTVSDSNTLGGVDAMINGSRMFSITGDDENRFEVLDSGIRAIQIIGNNTYTQTFARGNGFIPVKVNNISANSFGDLTLPLTTPDNGVISGGIVTWLQDYDYNISAAVYNIAGVTYNSPSTNITLDPSDPTFDRIDSFVLTNIGTAEYLTGTPSSSPSSPTADPNSQIEVGIALILANSTQPTITQLFIYNENIEWTVASSSTIDAASINTPIAGTVSIEGTNTVPNDYISFSDSSLDTSTYNILSFRIRPKAPWSNDKKLNFRFYSQSPSADTAVGDIISIGNGSYGFDSNNLTDQIISIPLSIFNLNAEIDKLEIRVLGTSGSIGFFIDSIKLEQGVINVYNNANNFWTNSGSDIYNTNTGNVIIPTKLTVGKNVTPTSKLDLYDDTVTATPTATQGLTLVNSSLSTALSTAKSSPGVYFKGNAWDGFNTINTATNFKIYNQARTFGNISAAGVKYSSLVFESDDTGVLHTPLTLMSTNDVIFGNGLSMIGSVPGLKLLFGGTLGSNEYRSAAGTAHAHLFATDGNSIQNGKAVVKIQPRQNINPLGSLGVLVSGDYDQNILSTLNLGSVGIGTITPSPYASLDTVSTGRGVRVPGLTTEQRDQITTGVISITVDNGGSNYTLVPTVNIAASSVGGLQARARAVLTAGVVTSVIVEFRGSGYLSVPAVTFTNQISDITGSGAAATAVVGTDAIPEGLIIYNTDNKSIEYNNSTNWESLNSSLHLNFQEVTDNGSITTNGITVDSIDIISLLSLNGDSGTAGQILTSQGGGLPTWEDLPTIGLDDVLGVGNASLNKNIVLGESTEDSMAIIDTNNPNKYILPTRVTTAQRLRMGSKLRVEIESGLGGSGYITPPQITLPACPAWGVQATATAILTAGVVTSLVMPNEGRGYKIPPGNAIVNNTGTGGTGLSVLYFSTTDPITPGAIVYDTDLKAYFYYDDNDNWRMMSTYSEAAVYWSSLPDPTYYQVGSETLLVLTDLTGAASSVELDLSSQEIPGRKITFLNLNDYLVSGRSYIPQPSSKYVRLSGGLIDAVPSLKVSSIVYSGELDKWIQVIEY